MDNYILFSGCSYTYGEGLWRETGDIEESIENQKYLLENRWITKVSNHFNINRLSNGYNGGTNIHSLNFAKKQIEESRKFKQNIKLIIFQTTHFGRDKETIDEQILLLENFVKYVESKSINIRFIHWIWPDISEYEMKFYLNDKSNPNPFRYIENNKSMGVGKHVEPPEDGNRLCSKIIRDRTIYILNEFNFQPMVNHSDFDKKNSLPKKYTLAGKFKCKDYHMNQEGHDVLANEIINYIEQNKLL